MTTYTTIPDADIDQDSPGTQPLFAALRDNPIAIAEGAAGAPRVANAAITDGTIGAEKFQAGATEINWVAARTAGAGFGGVGTYAFLYNDNTIVAIGPGTNVAGSNLRYSDANNTVGSTPAGTWKCMGNAALIPGSNANATLYLRIL